MKKKKKEEKEYPHGEIEVIEITVNGENKLYFTPPLSVDGYYVPESLWDDF